MMKSNSIMNSADVEMQKVVVADLIRLSPDEQDVLNQFDLATCDERIQELVNFIKYPTRKALISDVLCQFTLLYQQKSQLEAKRYLQLQTDHQMALQRENAVKFELSKAEERMEKAEAKLVDLKADELKKASSQRGQQTPTVQVLNFHLHSQQLQQPQQGADSDSRHPAPRSGSSFPKFSQSVQLTSTDLNKSVGSQMVSSGVLPNSIAVNNHQDDQVPDTACTSGPIWWEEHPSSLIGTPLLSDSVSTPSGQERCTWLSGDSIEPDPPSCARVHSLESSHLNHEKTYFLPPFHEPHQLDFSDHFSVPMLSG
ncbi:hypothetical protein AMECASPLE_039241 [Ameca splendens]|uniref:Uncharacterized protein n=1 Tax=Ameca splendens TaxID=208324 RepID=A0ABV0XXC9_9TELE